MRRLWTSFLAFGLACTLAAGCSRESNKGGPGATVTPKKETTTTSDGKTTTTTETKSTNGGDRTQTFTVKVPSTSTSVRQGERKEVTVSVSRGSNFDSDVHLTFKAPAGLKVEPASATAKKGSDDVRVTVEAASDATVGTSDVHVNGHGGSGPDAAVDFKVEVKKKD